MFLYASKPKRQKLIRKNFGQHSLSSMFICIDLACVARVSVLFPSKDPAKMARVSGEGVGKKGRKETLADKPRDFENRPHRLSCLSARTDI